MKRPSFQFYPCDWTSDLKLRRCSPAARGVWLDVLCAFHDSDDGYGMLRWPLKDIANTIGASPALLRELVDKGVLRGSDKNVDEALIYIPRSGRKDGTPVTLVGIQAGPLWYSKRMVVDEYVRTIRGESSRFGADEGAAPKVQKKPAPKPPLGDGTSSPSPSSPSGGDTEDFSGCSAGAHDDPPEGFQPTAAGALCRALANAGISRTNPGNLRLTTLLEAGATAAEFLAYVDKAKDADDPFAYVIGCVEGERKRAKRNGAEMHRGRLPSRQEAIEQHNRAAAAEWLEQQKST